MKHVLIDKIYYDNHYVKEVTEMPSVQAVNPMIGDFLIFCINNISHNYLYHILSL